MNSCLLVLWFSVITETESTVSSNAQSAFCISVFFLFPPLHITLHYDRAKYSNKQKGDINATVINSEENNIVKVIF